MQRREEELRQRRNHVEHLIRWHQRLDEEEQAVVDMERQFMAQTNTVRLQKSSKTVQRRKQIANIEHSLEVLQSMSGRRSIDNKTTTDRINMSGSKLNRLWRRLTGDSSHKFEPAKRYVLTKVDIERLYEDAKLVVLGQFDDGGPMVLDQTANNTLTSAENPYDGNQMTDEFVVVPPLNLELTSADEELSSITTDAEHSECTAHGYYFSDHAPRSAEKSNSETTAVQLEVFEEISENNYTSDFAISSLKSNQPDSISTSSQEPNYIIKDIPNETLINDVSCPPFEITASSGAQDFDNTISQESSNHTYIASEIVDEQISINSDIESSASNRMDKSNESNIKSSIKTVSGPSNTDDDTPQTRNFKKDEKSHFLLVEEIVSSQESPSATSVSENLEESSSLRIEEVSEESASSTTKTNIEDFYASSGAKLINEELSVGTAQILAPRDYVSPIALEKPASKMPDIISEAEVLRRQQMEIEQEVRQIFPCSHNFMKLSLIHS